MDSYHLIDSGDFEKLEQVGPFRLVRPSPSAVWPKKNSNAEWSKVDAIYKRFQEGEGEWTIHNKKIEKPWGVKVGDIQFVIKLTGFGHLGIFPEQEPKWLQISDLISKFKKKSEKPFRVLNLFAYTGGSTLFSAKAGAEVVHVDASKTSVTWARENAQASGLSEKPVRWITDDVRDFVAREVRRGSLYEGIILDPPSYGRGPKKQLWKIETHLSPLLNQLKQIMSEDFGFLLLSSHSPGYTPQALENILKPIVPTKHGQFDSGEMLIKSESGLHLPSGASSLWYN